MFELYRELERSLQEISKQVGRTLKVFAKSGCSAAETYLAAIRAIGGLQAVWTRHMEIERELFPRMLCRNLLPAESLRRIAENNRGIERQLAAMLAAPWPRSPQAGLQSIRTGGIKVLIALLAQIEAERATLLQAISGMDRSAPVIAPSEREGSELVAR